MESSLVQILVVDDEPDIVSLVEYHLEKVGFAVLTAATAEEALQQIQSSAPALVVLDLMLPECRASNCSSGSVHRVRRAILPCFC